MNQSQQSEAQSKSMSRREWLQGAVVLAGTVAGGALLAPARAAEMPAKPAMAPVDATASDVAILNFALTLEYLEADYYSRAVQTHQGLLEQAKKPDTIVVAKPLLNERVVAVVQAIRDHELAHVQFLTDTIKNLGGTPVARPNFQYPGDVFVSPLAFLNFATKLEETGIGAYLGALPRLHSPELRRTVASIYGVETRHAGLLRQLDGRLVAPRFFESALTNDQVQSMVGPFIVR